MIEFWFKTSFYIKATNPINMAEGDVNVQEIIAGALEYITLQLGNLPQVINFGMQPIA